MPLPSVGRYPALRSHVERDDGGSVVIVTWTVLRSRLPTRSVPWHPRGACWWQAGQSGAGRAEPPLLDGRWWSVLATWPGRGDAEAAVGPRDDLDAWHVVLDAASFRGDAALARGARPFDALPTTGRIEGAAAVVTLAALGPDGAREREFFRRFLHLGRGLEQARGHVAAVVQAPDDGAVLTFSAWEDLGAALDWSYVQAQHAAAVARQRTHRLVEASGFLRCAVLSSSGTLGDLHDPLAGLRGSVARSEQAGYDLSR